MFRRSQKGESADSTAFPTESEAIDTSMEEYECNDISDSFCVGKDGNGTLVVEAVLVIMAIAMIATATHLRGQWHA